MRVRNVTFRLPADLIRRVKAYAAERDTTMTALVRELLEQALDSRGRARAAGVRLLALAERGPYFSTDPGSVCREDLHKRR